MGSCNSKHLAIGTGIIALIAIIITCVIALILAFNVTPNPQSSFMMLIALPVIVVIAIYRCAVIHRCTVIMSHRCHALAAIASTVVDLLMVTACSREAWHKVVDLMRKLGLCEVSERSASHLSDSDESDYCLDGDLWIWIVINWCIYVMAMVVYHISAWRLLVGSVATADDTESQPFAVQSDNASTIANRMCVRNGKLNRPS